MDRSGCRCHGYGKGVYSSGSVYCEGITGSWV